MNFAFLAFVLVSVAFVPFLISKTSKLKKRDKVYAKIKQLALEKGLELNEIEEVGQGAIGIDRSQQVVAFLRKEENEERLITVELSAIRSCEKVTQYLPDSGREIEILRMELTAFDGKVTFLEFYNAHENFLITDEFVCLEKWFDIIHTYLNNKPKEEVLLEKTEPITE